MDETRATSDPLRNIRSYNDEMTISQVIRYFERQNVVFTKPMIQGYVRAGLLPMPKEKRYYTRGHMVLLALIEGLKKGFPAEEVKRLFGALDIYGGGGDFADKSEEMLAVYGAYISLMKDVRAALDGLSEEISGEAKTGATVADGRAAFLTAAALMAGSVFLREAAERTLGGRNETL